MNVAAALIALNLTPVLFDEPAVHEIPVLGAHALSPFQLDLLMQARDFAGIGMCRLADQQFVLAIRTK